MLKRKSKNPLKETIHRKVGKAGKGKSVIFSFKFTRNIKKKTYVSRISGAFIFCLLKK